MARAKRKRHQSPRGSQGRSRSGGQGWTPSAIPAPTLVQSAAEFAQMLHALEGQPWLAVDTESDSLYRYTPRVCLIQISAPAPKGTATSPGNPIAVLDFLVDPLRLRDVSALGEILADERTEIILHAAENDILILQRDFDFFITRLFDTQLAARILGRKGVGLARILQEEFGVVSDKRMQRTNWGQRPLTAQQMTYAQMDTHYLPALRDRQIDRLQKAGRWQEAQEAFRLLETLEYSPPEPRTFWQMKQTRNVDEENLGVLQAVWAWREEEAARSDRPPFKVVGENVLVALAQERPDSLGALRRVQGLSQRQIDRYGRALLAAVRQGAEQPLPARPSSAPSPEQMLSPAERKRFDALRQWRTRAANARGVDPDIVFSNDLLLQITTSRPDSVAALEKIPAIGAWKAATYGPDVLRVLRNGGGK